MQILELQTCLHVWVPSWPKQFSIPPGATKVESYSFPGLQSFNKSSTSNIWLEVTTALKKLSAYVFIYIYMYMVDTITQTLTSSAQIWLSIIPTIIVISNNIKSSWLLKYKQNSEF